MTGVARATVRRVSGRTGANPASDNGEDDGNGPDTTGDADDATEQADSGGDDQAGLTDLM